MAKTRLYKVITATTVRLVEATSRQSAIAHAASKEITADIPSQRDVFDMASRGVSIEVVGGAPPSDESRAAAAQSCPGG